MKLDITNVPRELDEMIASSSSARHRRILENVRRHYLLEQTGRWPEILTPDMTVDDPLYFLDLDGTSRTLRGRAEVATFYKEVTGLIFATEETAHGISDSGYWFEAWFNFYLPGEDDTWLRKRQLVAMRWPFDQNARLIGEHVYEHVDVGEVVPIDRADVITAAEAKEILTPLIRPLPT